MLFPARTWFRRGRHKNCCLYRCCEDNFNLGKFKIENSWKIAKTLCDRNKLTARSLDYNLKIYLMSPNYGKYWMHQMKIWILSEKNDWIDQNGIVSATWVVSIRIKPKFVRKIFYSIKNEHGRNDKMIIYIYYYYILYIIIIYIIYLHFIF